MDTGKKYRTALVHSTINAVQPINSYIQKNASDLKPVNYLDGALMDVIGKEGGITDHSMSRFLDLLSRACDDEADGIILTCTVFTPYQEAFQALFKPPIVCADAAMLDQLSKQEGRTAIICTFEGTVDTSRDGYKSYCRKNGTDEQVDMYVVSGALDAIAEGDAEKFHELIRDKIREIDAEYDNIALAQMSMSGAAERFIPEHARIFTSPACAVAQLRNILSDNNSVQ